MVNSSWNTFFPRRPEYWKITGTLYNAFGKIRTANIQFRIYSHSHRLSRAEQLSLHCLQQLYSKFRFMRHYPLLTPILGLLIAMLSVLRCNHLCKASPPMVSQFPLRACLYSRLPCSFVLGLVKGSVIFVFGGLTRKRMRSPLWSVGILLAWREVVGGRAAAQRRRRMA
jgi:hypothetical protein